MRTVEKISHLAAPAPVVWNRLLTAEGINEDMRPWLTMSLPPGLSTGSLDHAPVGVPLGRAWLRAFGVVPFEWDNLMLAELEPGRRFHEISSMITAWWWEHERTLTPIGAHQTRVHDRVVFQARRGGHVVEALMHLLVNGVFTHRHHRLQRHFGVAPY